MRRRAACLIPPSPHYSRDEFFTGLAAVGLDVGGRAEGRPKADDVLVIWNRRRHEEQIALRYESAGATVIVAENGYIGADEKPPRFYAVAKNHHLGAGAWFVGTEDRWPGFGIQVQSWRSNGEHILVLPQRGIGEPGIAMPRAWPIDVERRLRAVTDRPIKVRNHPGKRPHPPLDPDFENCWAVVIWGSGAGIKAICAGVPVFHELSSWVGAGAAKFGIADIENPFCGDRSAMLHRLSYAQWSAEEVVSGEPFRCLLQ